MTKTGLRALDRRLFVNVASRGVRFGPAIRRLSILADHSLLWGVIAALLARFGGRRGRRAALRGVSSIAAASLLANQPAKRAFRRARPALRGHPDVRRPSRMPTSASFPSGHAASAFAFAMSAGAELPRFMRAPLLALAGTIGFARVYVGAHYPGDVIAGAAVGCAVTAISLRAWPLPPIEPGSGPRQEIADAPALADGDGLALVVNRWAGSHLDARQLQARLPQARVVERGRKEDLTECLRAVARNARVLGIAGGDGSANAGAQVAYETGLPLLVVPGGTLNHLCRDLGLQSVLDAVDALAAGRAISVDLGEIDGKLFVNTASFGGYPQFVAHRERLEGRIGKLPATLVAGLQAMRHTEVAELELDGERVCVWVIFIGNCRYEPAGAAPSVRVRLDDGLLDVRLLDASRPYSRLRVLAAILAGQASRSPSLRSWTAQELRVRSLAGPLRTARDGELSDHQTARFIIRKKPRALVIYGGPKPARHGFAPTRRGRRVRGILERQPHPSRLQG